MQLTDNQYLLQLHQWFTQSTQLQCTSNGQQEQWPVREWIKSLAKANLLVAGWPAPYGDGELRKQLHLHYRIARDAPGSLGLCITSHLDIGARCLLEKASLHLAEQWLAPALRGEAILALAMTEPQAGSDLQGIEFSAEKNEQGWSLTGVKRGITNLPFADAVIVLARTAPGRSPFSYTLFLLPMDTPGVVREAALPTLAYPGCLGGMQVTNALIPEHNVLGSPGAGLILLMQHMATERLFVSARMRGISEMLLEKIQQHNVLLSNQLATLKTQCLAFNAYFEQCVESYISQSFPARESASLKYLGSRLLKTLCATLGELDGAAGYLAQGNAELYRREAMGLALAGGSEEIMLAIIGSEL
ncbi:MAG: acyl-CoA dehydrogenase family protein [Cellvibrio sp.]|uniref:acyl-CoA dehydrogenase family protein n=1 Tax=Cellvibrio sp. TaxID=1965322 RepID=UPI002721ACF0|nr:acyl-CoA dehydrogenase family protein [Cellvibrio sp.]